MDKRGLIGSIIVIIALVLVIGYVVLVTTGSLSIQTDKVNVDIGYNDEGNEDVETISVTAGSGDSIAIDGGGSGEEEIVEVSNDDLIVPVSVNGTNESLNYTNVSS